MERMTFFTTNDEGERIQCEAMFTFEDQEKGYTYIVYTDYSLDENGMKRAYAGYIEGEFDIECESLAVKPILTAEEWTMIEIILTQLQKEEI